MDETTIANGEEEEVEEEDAIDDLYPKGIPETNSIIQYAVVPASGFSQSQIREAFSPEEAERLKLRPDDVTVPAAVRMLFPDQFGSQTNARKASRRRKILVHRGPLLEGKGGKDEFDRERLSLGKVGHRVAPGDALAVQTRMEHNYSECKNHDAEPPFHLPVVYQDDHIAVVNKPEGVVVFSHKNGGFGRHNVKSCLPWALDPPRAGVVSVMRRPNPVHRIDRGTSGLLVVAKTKPAMVGLASMFRERRVKKTCESNCRFCDGLNEHLSPRRALLIGIASGD